MAYNFNYNQQFQRPMGYKVMPVANEFEMNNVTVDFNGTPTYFHNQNSNEIYVRQFDMKTGLTTTQKYIKSDVSNAGLNGSKPETDINLYEEKFNALNERLDGLKEMLEAISDKGGKK